MKTYTVALMLILALAGCSDSREKLRQEAIKDYPEFWQKPDQIASLRREHAIPEDYKFQRLEFIGGAGEKGARYGLYEWSFRFVKQPRDYIEIRHICYYDVDAVVPFDVKQERIHWLDFKIARRTFHFRGVEEP